jgi:acid ceramidase
VFKTTGFAGYVGALSGIRPGGFSLTIDQRFYPGGIDEFFWQVIAAIEERNASLVSFLSRLVLENENTFGAALDGLSDDELIADVYYIVAGK